MSGSDWTPVHHVQAEEPEGEAHTESKPAKPSGKGGSGGTQAPVSLTLNLPADFTSAMGKLATAIEENTKATNNLISILTKAAGGSTSAQ